MQDIYKQRSNWKIILAALGTIILIVTLLYSSYLAKKLEESELKNGTLYSEAINKMFEDIDSLGGDLNKDVSTDQEIIEAFALPVIIKDEMGMLEGHNFSPSKDTNAAFLTKKVDEFLAHGRKPYIGTGYAKEIYIFNSNLLTYIRWYPLLQLFLVGSFIGLGYFLFNSSKRAEQNRVWAGMAKETAHQLGTPISAIMGWVSTLKETYGNNNDIMDITNELEKDVDRLNLVTDRFSKIGSAPDLKELSLTSVCNNVLEYMRRRTPKNIELVLNNNKDIKASINEHLFEWVLENLIRNSLDAMDSKGTITLDIYEDEKYKYIDVKDTGKGIPTGKFKTIFNPGFSTKKRGWGLGLSLAKRIIEEYHKGKIYVKESVLDQGTTFTIRL